MSEKYRNFAINITPFNTLSLVFCVPSISVINPLIECYFALNIDISFKEIKGKE